MGLGRGPLALGALGFCSEARSPRAGVPLSPSRGGEWGVRGRYSFRVGIRAFPPFAETYISFVPTRILPLVSLHWFIKPWYNLQSVTSARAKDVIFTSLSETNRVLERQARVSTPPLSSRRSVFSSVTSKFGGDEITLPGRANLTLNRGPARTNGSRFAEGVRAYS